MIASQALAHSRRSLDDALALSCHRDRAAGNRFSRTTLLSRRSFSSVVSDASLIDTHYNIFKNKSRQEQRLALFAALGAAYKFDLTFQQINQNDVVSLLKYAAACFRNPANENSPLFNIYNSLIKNNEWTEKDWDSTLHVLLTFYGLSHFKWISSKKSVLFKTTPPSIWEGMRLPMYHCNIVKRKEEDKSEAVTLLPKLLQSKTVKKVIAVYEGVWHGIYLIDIYRELINNGFKTTLVGTDINPASLALFSIYALQIAKIPSENVKIFFNDIRFPISRSELTNTGVGSENAMTLHLYFRTLIDLNERECEYFLQQKSEEMQTGDYLITTLAEETLACQIALGEARLSLAEKGTNFNRYTRLYREKHESSVLVFNSKDTHALDRYLKRIECIYRLTVESDQRILVDIELGPKSGTPLA